MAHYPTSSSSGRVYTMTGNGAGAFTTVGQATTTIPNTNGVARLCAVDSDGDGRDEVCAGIGCNPYSGPIFNYNPVNADASFGTWAGRGGSITSPGYGVTTAVIAGDFLGTGTPAVLAVMAGAPSYNNTQALRLFSGASLSTMVSLPSPSSTTKDLTVIDADFDTKLDWAVTTSPSSIQVYRGSTLASVMTLDASIGSPSITSPLTGKLASGDLDNDGRPDLVATTSYWIAEGMAIYIGSSTYKLGTSGDGGSKGMVFYLNASN